jgi:hypothetical protein
MQFTNVSADGDLDISGVGYVPAGSVFTVSAEQAAGLVLQCNEGGNFQPADAEAEAAVASAFSQFEPEVTPNEQPETPPAQAEAPVTIEGNN